MGWSGVTNGIPGYGILTFDTFPNQLILQSWRSTGRLTATFEKKQDNRVYLAGRIFPVAPASYVAESVISYLPAWRSPSTIDEMFMWAYPLDSAGNSLRVYVSRLGQLRVYSSTGAPPYGDLDGYSYYEGLAYSM